MEASGKHQTMGVAETSETAVVLLGERKERNIQDDSSETDRAKQSSTREMRGDAKV
jgi:hypothetical protein